MDFELTQTQQLIRDTARKFAREVVAPRARDTDREERFPTEVYRQMGELRLLGVNVPAEYGGAEAGVVSYALAIIEISAACASTSVGMAVTMCRGADRSVRHRGPEEAVRAEAHQRRGHRRGLRAL